MPDSYWFYHEYLDETRRFRINRIEIDNERDARRQHKQACDFQWVTRHAEPSVSSLFVKTDEGQRALIPGHRPGDPYHTQIAPSPMPAYIRQLLAGVKARTLAD